jgi:hypothetical protein
VQAQIQPLVNILNEIASFEPEPFGTGIGNAVILTGRKWFQIDHIPA